MGRTRSLCGDHGDCGWADASYRGRAAISPNDRHRTDRRDHLHPGWMAYCQATQDVGVSAMIFETLHESAQRGELILMNGGMCHWHLRRDGQITIREIIILPEHQRHGIGSAILAQLKAVPGANSIFAKCPYDLGANEWYHRQGFVDEGIETTKTGRWLRLWRLQL